jgi:hypothetical protein
VRLVLVQVLVLVLPDTSLDWLSALRASPSAYD